MISTIRKITEPLSRRVSLLVSRCVLNIIKDDTKTQTAQGEFFAGEVHDDCEIWQNFGFTSVPPKGSEGVALFVGGERENPLIVATECKEKRMTGLKEGEAAVYSSAGDHVYLKSDNSIEMKTKKLTINAENSVQINLKSISIINSQSQEELIDILSTLCDLLSKDKVNTAIGQQPLLSFALYAQLKLKLDSFKPKR